MKRSEALYSESGKEVVISVSNLTKRFQDRTVLDEFCIDLYRGESLVILGRSGSGKSVLIKCIIGLLKPDLGSVNVLGEDVLALGNEGLDELRERVGFLFQSNALYDSMTVRENLEFSMRRHKRRLNRSDARKKVLDTLENVGLKHTLDMMPSMLSGGMQKRIALARTLVLSPEVVLYDEPTTGLDPVTGKEIAILMNEVQEKYGTSSIVISHDMKCVERTADRIALLVGGRCYATDTYENLKRSADPNIKQFFD
jgi:phospholipid/cholesterol/gamma-HCH transport system ATP-binding protein